MHFLASRARKINVSAASWSLKKGEIYLGLIVDDVFGMQHFNAETFRLDSELQVSTIANYVQGSYEHAKRQWVVFRPVQLIEDDNFYTVAA